MAAVEGEQFLLLTRAQSQEAQQSMYLDEQAQPDHQLAKLDETENTHSYPLIIYTNMQYKLYLNGSLRYVTMDEPTPEQLEALGCDSYEIYEEPEETPEQYKARVKQALISTPDLSAVDLE